MRPKIATFQLDEINLTMWFKNPDSLRDKRKFLIFCYGLPSHPYQHNPAKVERLIEECFVLVYPFYIGTWGSSGTMSWEKCVDTILKTVDFIKSENGVGAYDKKNIGWKCDEVILVGGSFGGSVALVAGAKSKHIKKIISVAGPTNWRDHSRIDGERAEPIEYLYYSIERGWKNLWRIPNKHEWERLVTGEADLNPVDYVEQLKDKSTLLVHGKNDQVVHPDRSIKFNESLKKGKGNHEIIVLDGKGHLGNDFVGQPEVVDNVLEFIRK